MNNHSSFRIHPLLVAAIVVAGFFVMLIAAYAITRNVSEDEVMGRVEVAGTPIGGMSREEATSTVLGVEDLYSGRQATFSIEGSTVNLEPPEAGFYVDEEAIVDEALAIGREGNAAYQFLWWFTHLFSTEEITLVGGIDPGSLDMVFDRWDNEVIGMPASLGAIVMEEGIPQPVYPATGVGVDRVESTEIIETTLLAEDPSNHDLPTTTIIPRLSDTDIDQALLEANQILSDDITLVFNGDEVVFTPEQLAAAYRSETISEGTPQILHYFDAEVVDSYLTGVRSKFEAEPVNAEFQISGDAIVIIEGRNGTRIDEQETADKLLQAGRGTSRLGQLPFVEDADPDVTTEELEALGIEHLVSSFTTYHSCCQDRVVNIQTMADTIDGHIVRSGQQFSINEFVGQRTLEKGYLPAGTIIAGELKDTVGGGVSQFATTMYNAIFWAGLEDIEHSPHSYYFTRYPEGIEATVNWRTPDLVWRNNYRNAVLIDTQHTDTSITVRIFGSNHGRTVKGEQKGGETILTTVNSGGPEALHVVAEVSDRYAQTSPGTPRYIPNPGLGLDEVVQTQEERGGWSVNVIRRILRGGEQTVSEQEWVVRYRPQFAVIEVHPCKVPGREDTCPSTTTIPPTTTPSTTPSSTAPEPPTTTTTTP